MSALATPMDARGCKAEAELAGSVAVVRIHGSAEGETERLLHSFIDGVHDAVCAAGVSCVRVELGDLQFMSSSCLKCFVRWLSSVEDLGQSARYAVTFVSDPASHWQKRSLRALQTLAPEVVTLA